MIFSIQNSNNDDPIIGNPHCMCNMTYPILAEKYNAVSSSNATPSEEHALIQIDTLERLLDLAEDLGHELIVGGELDGRPRLLIYDGYIE